MTMFQSGTCFAGCKIVRIRGVGRFAVVYEVIAPDGMRRALKVLRAAGIPLDAKINLRLGQEGEAIATIEHVHVVRFFADGVEENRVWILFELVDGLDLRQLMREAGGALPVDRAVRLVRQACEGVAAAHALKILHRDLKPENILVADDGDLAKVTDFGSAKPEHSQVKTTKEQDVSSSLYMAPDFMLTRVAQPRSDVYSMGITLYEILTGQHPVAPGPMGAMEICARQLTYEPAPLATLGRDIPGDLSDLVQRALSKDPASRPEMREMADTLGVVQARLNAPRRALARNLRLPNREEGFAVTEPAMAAFSVSGVGGTIPMAAFDVGEEAAASSGGVSGGVVSVGSTSGSGASGREVSSEGAPPSPGAASQGAPSQGPSSRDASLPPAPSAVPTTRPSPAWPAVAMATVAMSEVAPGVGPERASTGVPPVERSVTRASLGPRVVPAIAVVVAAVVVAGLVAGWVLVGRGGRGGGPAEGAAAGPVATATATAVTAGSARGPAPVVTADGGAPHPRAPVPAVTARPRGVPQPRKSPFQ
jgi:serine/threonine-protein kinase